MSEEVQDQPFLSEQEQQFLAVLLRDPRVCAVLEIPETKILAASIQQKVTNGNQTP